MSTIADVIDGRPLNCYADDGRESQINLSLKPPPFLFFAARSGAHFRRPLLRLPGGVRSRSVAGGRVSPLARRRRNQGTQFNGKNNGSIFCLKIRHLFSILLL